MNCPKCGTGTLGVTSEVSYEVSEITDAVVTVAAATASRYVYCSCDSCSYEVEGVGFETDRPIDAMLNAAIEIGKNELIRNWLCELRDLRRVI